MLYVSDSDDEEQSLLGVNSTRTPLEGPTSMISPYQPPSTARNPVTSWYGATMLMVGGMAGTGVLAVPAATNEAGWIGIGLLVVTAVICTITANLLGAIMRRMDQNSIRDYSSLGGAAFGKWGEFAAVAAQYTTIVGVSIVFLLLSGQLLNSIISTVPARFFSLLLGVLLYIAVLVLRTVKEVSWVSYIAVIATFGGALFVVILSLQYYLGSDYPCSLASTSASCPLCEHYIARPTIATAFAVYSFSFGGHSLFPNFFMEMKKTKDYPKSTVLAFAATLLLLYFPVAVTGYLAYGAGLLGEGVVLGAIAKFSNSSATPIYVAVISGIFCVHLLTALPIIAVPICLKAERKLLNKDDRRRRSWKLVLLRLVIIAFLTVMAMIFPYFLEMISIVTALSVVLTVYIFPALFYWKLRTSMHKGKWITIFSRIGLALIILFGVGGSIASLVNAIPSLITAVKCGGNPFHNTFCFGATCPFGGNCTCPMQKVVCAVSNATSSCGIKTTMDFLSL